MPRILLNFSKYSSSESSLLLLTNLSISIETFFTVSFKEPIFWRISELISLLSLVALICLYAYIRANKVRYMKK